MDTSLNRHLWLLTGRHSDFVNPELNTGVSYGDLVPSEEVAAARATLHLGDRTTDYYVIGAMAALRVFRPSAGPDTTSMFLPHSLHIRPPSIAGGTIQPMDKQQPSLLYRPADLPVARRWYVTRVSGDVVRITTDTGYMKDVPYRMAASVVYPEWPEEIGFSAAFAPTGGNWQDGSQVIISTEPSGYPYSAVARTIKNSIHLIRLMATEGTLADFHAARSSIQKVGALTAAVVQWSASHAP
jgi:hypothetical protein